jgi:hypothetical protein
MAMQLSLEELANQAEVDPGYVRKLIDLGVLGQERWSRTIQPVGRPSCSPPQGLGRGGAPGGIDHGPGPVGGAVHRVA